MQSRRSQLIIRIHITGPILVKTPCLEGSNPILAAFYIRRRIIHLDELGQTFVVRLAIRLQYKDGQKTHYLSGQIIFRCSS